MYCLSQFWASARLWISKILSVVIGAGIFSGVSMLLLAIFIVMLCASPAVRARGDVRYMNTVFYVFR